MTYSQIIAASSLGDERSLSSTSDPQNCDQYIRHVGLRIS